MTLVVAGFVAAVVRLVTVCTFSQIGDTRVVAGDGICAVGILIVAVGIVIVDVLQCRLVCFCFHVVAVAGTQIVFVEVVANLAVSEVVCLIMGISLAVHVIDDRLYALVIFEAAVVGTPILAALGSDIAAFHTEVIDVALVLFEE